MKIFRNNTNIADVWLKDNSYMFEEINGQHVLSVNFDVLFPVDLLIDDYITEGGSQYHVRYPERIRKEEASLGYSYTVLLYHEQYKLQDVPFFLFGKRERKKNFDTFRGSAKMVLDLIVKCMNAELGGGWSAGSCIDTEFKTFNFKDMQCSDVINAVISEYTTEFWIESKVISIGRREFSSNGLILGQGSGQGFKELEVSAVSEEPPYTVIYPYGGDKNLGSDYGADYLLLPDGLTELEKNTDKYGRRGKHVSFPEIYPKGEFTVTSKIDNYTLQASGIDFNITDCLLDGVEVIVTFQDGELAGYDLAIVDKSWDNSKKQFKLKVNEQENALKVPGDINFEVGDKFILTGLKMPQSYINNAQLKLKEESLKWLDLNAENQVQLSGKCDDILFKSKNTHIACGQMVGVFSDRLSINREIRTIAVKRYLENPDKDGNAVEPYRYEITLSDFLQSNGFKQLIDDVKAIPTEIEDSIRPVREWTKRSWKDVMETLGMMFDPEGDFFTELITPLVVHTAQLIVGTNSQQFDLIGVKFIPNADDNANYFKSTAGSLVHFTINEDGSTRTWNIASSSHSLSNSYPYYVYAKCPRVGSSGIITVSTNPIKLLDDPTYYYFWIGVLNTPQDGVRSWNPNYGYTEIAGQTITTGIIKDKYARLIIDLINGEITGKVTFKSGSSGYNNLTDKPDIDGKITTASNNLYNFITGSFEDGVIDEAEAKAIIAYLNVLKAEKAQLDSSYNTLYANPILEGTVKTNLSAAKTNLNTAYNNLISVIEGVAVAGTATPMKKAEVDSYYNTYKNALSTYAMRSEEAYKAIQDKLDALSAERVNNLVFGGVNLLANSDHLKAGLAATGITSAMQGDGSLKVVASSGNMNWFGSFLDSPVLNAGTLKANDLITISYWARSTNSNKKPAIYLKDGMGYYEMQGTMTGEFSQMYVTVPYAVANSLALHLGFQSAPGTYYFKYFKVERGNKPTDWSPAPADFDSLVKAQLKEYEYLKTALLNKTTIDGGLVLTTLLKLGAVVNGIWQERAGINGSATNDSDVVAWFGGTLQNAIQNLASIVFRLDGSGQLAKGNITWDKDGNAILSNIKAINGDFTGKIATNVNGNKIVLDPSNRNILLQDSSGKTTGTWQFSSNSRGSVSEMILSSFSGNTCTAETIILPADLVLQMPEKGTRLVLGLNPSTGKVSMYGNFPTQAEASGGTIYTDSNGFLKQK